MSESVLLLTKKEFEKMEIDFIRNGYASPLPRRMGWGVRFEDFKNVKDIILSNGSFQLVLLNDYIKEETTLEVFNFKGGMPERVVGDFKFRTLKEFCLALKRYEKHLSKGNGTVQAIDWIFENKMTETSKDKNKSQLHELKIHPEYFEDVFSCVKNFEIRKNDRGFKVGDILVLREYNPRTQEFTGRFVGRTVTYITDYAQRDGYVVMGIVSTTPTNC